MDRSPLVARARRSGEASVADEAGPSSPVSLQLEGTPATKDITPVAATSRIVQELRSKTYKSPLAANARPVGKVNVTLTATGMVLLKTLVLAGVVDLTPVAALTSRTAKLSVSAMNRSPLKPERYQMES